MAVERRYPLLRPALLVRHPREYFLDTGRPWIADGIIDCLKNKPIKLDQRSYTFAVGKIIKKETGFLDPPNRFQLRYNESDDPTCLSTGRVAGVIIVC